MLLFFETNDCGQGLYYLWAWRFEALRGIWKGHQHRGALVRTIACIIILAWAFWDLPYVELLERFVEMN